MSLLLKLATTNKYTDEEEYTEDKDKFRNSIRKRFPAWTEDQIDKYTARVAKKIPKPAPKTKKASLVGIMAKRAVPEDYSDPMHIVGKNNPYKLKRIGDDREHIGNYLYRDRNRMLTDAYKGNTPRIMGSMTDSNLRNMYLARSEAPQLRATPSQWVAFQRHLKKFLNHPGKTFLLGAGAGIAGYGLYHGLNYLRNRDDEEDDDE